MPHSATQPTLVLLHGLRGSPLGLQTVADGLRQAGYDVRTPAVAPFAGAAPLAEYTPKLYADFIADYIKTNHLKRPIIIGHSMGSIIAAATATYYPDLINQRLILLSPISVRAALPFRLVTPLSALLPPRLIDHITTRFLTVDKSHLQASLAKTTLCSSDQTPKRRDTYKSAQFSARHSVGQFDLSRQTVHLIAGAEDHIVKQRDTKKLAHSLKAASLALLEGTGHLHNYERPTETVAAILDALSLK